MAQKDQNRCWPGYEPVKGKKPHSQGSCRPKTESKLAPSEAEFRGKRKRQLDRWKEEHPGTRRSAAQHLHAPEGEKQQASKQTASAVKKRGKKITAAESSTRSSSVKSAPKKKPPRKASAKKRK